ncbi:hypothetical protein ONZ51_g11537 [Trametes cubensis]|uniref:Protein N-terminal glutamine amidohydrolase n=1 Tax=Trametes cubensis TaxID=1111947 RepID=A0AAD7THG4_9APHY|nr:hypothetical protein ONZ51_g11537 [Trametes cubensis]
MSSALLSRFSPNPHVASPTPTSPPPPPLPPDSIYTSCYCEENIYLLAQTFTQLSESNATERRGPWPWQIFVVFISNGGKTVRNFTLPSSEPQSVCDVMPPAPRHQESGHCQCHTYPGGGARPHLEASLAPQVALWNQKAARDSDTGVVVWDYHVVLVLLPVSVPVSVPRRDGGAPHASVNGPHERSGPGTHLCDTVTERSDRPERPPGDANANAAAAAFPTPAPESRAPAPAPVPAPAPACASADSWPLSPSELGRGEGGGEAWVYDFDTTLVPVPCPWRDYVAGTFPYAFDRRLADQIDERFHRVPQPPRAHEHVNVRWDVHWGGGELRIRSSNAIVHHLSSPTFPPRSQLSRLFFSLWHTARRDLISPTARLASSESSQRTYILITSPPTGRTWSADTPPRALFGML